MQIFEKVSIQRCEGGPPDKDGFDRLGSKALYAFVYPNFMINRSVGTYSASLNRKHRIMVFSSSCAFMSSDI